MVLLRSVVGIALMASTALATPIARADREPQDQKGYYDPEYKHHGYRRDPSAQHKEKQWWRTKVYEWWVDPEKISTTITTTTTTGTSTSTTSTSFQTEITETDPPSTTIIWVEPSTTVADNTPTPAPTPTDTTPILNPTATPIIKISTPNSSTTPGKCTTKLLRRAWHTLTTSEKQAYLAAEQCLMRLPSKDHLGAARSRFDDLVKAHQIPANSVHLDGWFLPFHRLHMHAHETLLRTECGYTGAQPYWDEERDAGHFSTSEVFASENGFGGDGTGPGGCIETGPFSNYTLVTGPGFADTEHCIGRKIDDEISKGSSKAEVDACLEAETVKDAWACMSNQPHYAGHSGTGGEMANSISSPGDPLFYLHHTFLDRVWWRWQQKAYPERTTQIYGTTYQLGGGREATLDDELDMFGVIPNAKVRDVMDIDGDYLCVEYD